MTPAMWFQHLPLFMQLILALIMMDWLGIQCWQAQHVLMEVAHEAAGE